MNTFGELEEPTVLNLKWLFSSAYPLEAQNVPSFLFQDPAFSVLCSF